MAQRHQDGVILDNSFFIIDEKKPGFPISARIFQFIAIMIGSWSSISVFMESLAVPVNILQFDAAMLIAASIMYALCIHPTYNVVKQFFGVLFYVLFLFSRLTKIQNGFFILENLVLSRISSYYGYQEIQYKANYSTATTDTTLLMVMIMLPIVALLTIAIIRSRFINICSIVLFLPVSVSFLLGIIPSERYLIAYVIAVLYLTQSGYSFHHVANKEQKIFFHRIHSRAAVWLSLMGVMLFFLMKLFVTPEKYEEVTKINEMKTEMQSALFNFSIEDVTKKFTSFRLPNDSVSVGGLSGGDLGKTGQVRYTNTEHLRITAPLTSVTEGIYLKGYVGSVYTGDKWEGHSKEDTKRYQSILNKMTISEFAPINQVSMLLNRFSLQSASESNTRLKIPKFHYYLGKMNIEYMAANEKYLYAPYFTDYEQLEQMKDLQDLYTAPVKKKDKYELNYSFDIALGSSSSDFYYNVVQGNLGEYSTFEKLYRDYVYQVYTQVPEKGLEHLKEDFGTTKEKTAMLTRQEQIEYVKNYLQQNTQYSLSPGKLPNGKDYVEYFLYENKIGYCAHYASAATLMLRLMGVPARYVEGYAVGSADIVQSQENSTQDVMYYSDSGSSVNNVVQAEITVRDYNAHAWVEVYIDNCGWIPVEFTPGSAVEYNYTVMADMATVGNNINQYEEELKDPTVTLEDPTPTPTEELEEQPEKSQEEGNVTPPDSNATKEQAKHMDNMFLVMFYILMVGSAMIVVMLRLRISKRARHIKNHNKKALFLFIEIEKLLTVCNSLPKRARLEDSEDYVKEHCPYIDSDVFGGCMETVRKARFGKGKITRKELKEIEQFYQSLQAEAYEKLPYRKRIYLKLILFI